MATYALSFPFLLPPRATLTSTMSIKHQHGIEMTSSDGKASPAEKLKSPTQYSILSVPSAYQFGPLSSQMHYHPKHTAQLPSAGFVNQTKYRHSLFSRPVEHVNVNEASWLPPLCSRRCWRFVLYSTSHYVVTGAKDGKPQLLVKLKVFRNCGLFGSQLINNFVV